MKSVSVHCEGLTKSYDAHGPAVRDLSLTVTPGELLALLGPSGCGKTTTLRLVAGFEKPEAGRIVIGDREVVGPAGFVPPEQRQVGMVFQNYALFPHLTLLENVAYGLNGSRDRAERAGDLLKQVGLGGLHARMPHELSGGQQQRVALARALAPGPKVLLFDEPFSNLDADLRAEMREQVRAILKMVSATALFVTHDHEEALFMGDRVAVLNAGRLEQVGTPEEIFHAPATHFVAEFMGHTDFLPGRVVAGGVETEIGLLAQDAAWPVGTPVEVAFRADDVALAPDPNASARILARHFKGALNVYRVRLPSGRLVHSLQPHTLGLAAGAPVRVWAAPGHPLACFPAAP